MIVPWPRHKGHTSLLADWLTDYARSTVLLFPDFPPYPIGELHRGHALHSEPVNVPTSSARPGLSWCHFFFKWVSHFLQRRGTVNSRDPSIGLRARRRVASDWLVVMDALVALFAPDLLPLTVATVSSFCVLGGISMWKRLPYEGQFTCVKASLKAVDDRTSTNDALSTYCPWLAMPIFDTERIQWQSTSSAVCRGVFETCTGS